MIVTVFAANLLAAIYDLPSRQKQKQNNTPKYTNFMNNGSFGGYSDSKSRPDLVSVVLPQLFTLDSLYRVQTILREENFNQL